MNEEFLNYHIEISNLSDYSTNTKDNTHHFSKIISNPKNVLNTPTSRHYIKILDHEKVVNVCLILGFAGATGMHKTSYVIEEDAILVCCSNEIFCISLPTLEVKWITTADCSTCFQIFKYENDYIIHGEVEISRIDSNGKIIWQISGSDIFVSIDENKSIELKNEHIELLDFEKNRYIVDYTGKLLMYYEKV